MSDDPRVQRAREALNDPGNMEIALAPDVIVADLLVAYDEQGALLAEDRSFRRRAIRAEAVVDELQAKIDMLDPDDTLCTTCGCTNRAWNNECPCPDQDCGCWEHRHRDQP